MGYAESLKTTKNVFVANKKTKLTRRWKRWIYKTYEDYPTIADRINMVKQLADLNPDTDFMVIPSTIAKDRKFDLYYRDTYRVTTRYWYKGL